MSLVNISGASGVAMSGYDPVSFFSNPPQPTNGNFEITATHLGATYYFVNEENKKTFEANPDKYAPQHGGFCAFGVSKGGLFPADMSTGQVYKGKLYINLNAAMLELFNKDIDGAIEKADANWPGLVKKNAIV